MHFTQTPDAFETIYVQLTILAARTLKSCRTLAHLGSCFRTFPSIEASAITAQH